ncbi:MAG: M20/M25/M40 family metallo-hydrolase [Psychrobium sp.]|nr:M20/M25/M40 family metallo-hydrolase [Psychrobium sp.]
MKNLYYALLSLAGISLSTLASEPLPNIESSKQVWITLGSDAYQFINQKHATQFNLRQGNLFEASNSDISLVSIDESKIDQLSELMHHEFNRCGGFFFHETFEQAQHFANAPAEILPLVAVNYSINNAAGVDVMVNELSAANLTSTVNMLTSFHNRYYNQQTGVDAATAIKNNWASIASDRSDISVEFYNHTWLQPSVIATVIGTTQPDEIVIIGGHIDSINQSNTSGRAPGADDNASGISVVTETLRALVASGFKPSKTVKFIGYAAEEVGLRGSNAIATDYKNTGKNVVGVAQFDMTGHHGTSTKDIVFMTDYTNSSQNQFMTQLIDSYFSDISYGYDQCGYGCSDHASWHNQGFAASIPFESTMSDINSSIHTVNDSSFDAQHGLKFAKLAVAFVAELAKGGTGDTPPPQDDLLVNGVAITGLSANVGQDIVFQMEVPAGATDISFSMSGGSGDGDLYVKFGANPTDSIYDCRPYVGGNNESCNATSSGGTYFIRIKPYTNFSGVDLIGRYTESGSGGGNVNIDRTESNIVVGTSQWQRYTQQLNADYTKLIVTISGGSGDADLYVRYGNQSSTSTYDCRPYETGNNESCSFNAPAAGTWYIDLRGYSAASNVTLNIKTIP